MFKENGKKYSCFTSEKLEISFSLVVEKALKAGDALQRLLWCCVVQRKRSNCFYCNNGPYSCFCCLHYVVCVTVSTTAIRTDVKCQIHNLKAAFCVVTLITMWLVIKEEHCIKLDTVMIWLFTLLSPLNVTYQGHYGCMEFPMLLMWWNSKYHTRHLKASRQIKGKVHNYMGAGNKDDSVTEVLLIKSSSLHIIYPRLRIQHVP